MRLVSILCCCGVLGVTTAVRAEPAQCLEAYNGSQRLRRSGDLVRAREALLSCAQQDCPKPIVKECTQWLAEVNASLPTVVFGAKDAQGNDIFDVKVFEGAVEVSQQLDGRSVYVNPGPHEFEFVFADGTRERQRVLVREAEKNRAVTVRQTPAAKPEAEPADPEPTPLAPEPQPDSGPPTLAIVLGSVGVAALTSFAYFGLTARADAKELDNDCAPDCPQGEVDSVRTKALVADISLAVGVASLGAATVIWINHTPPDSAGATRAWTLNVGGSF